MLASDGVRSIKTFVHNFQIKKKRDEIDGGIFFLESDMGAKHSLVTWVQNDFCP